MCVSLEACNSKLISKNGYDSCVKYVVRTYVRMNGMPNCCFMNDDDD